MNLRRAEKQSQRIKRVRATKEFLCEKYGEKVTTLLRNKIKEYTDPFRNTHVTEDNLEAISNELNTMLGKDAPNGAEISIGATVLNGRLELEVKNQETYDIITFLYKEKK